ncbi:hydroxymethylglutaryl-CoA lyase [Legionella birminghamensis]|uniref:hydroxymethylglutaryl-CoA lyase n=1 Tax=Legionella birminghamensis TaxID=28083 RepID=A0A378IAW3_9GAMM|nr:hydroxymethylglutaryl-CoA lyase [Legionella birminghamensis]KTC73045.1 hydroxymethylglutaryl-CoA lyase [Legionella birminghamensis]STX32378.1 hydroxymethylglutaryl-CoA lyase [Legionella birminghamensis]
MSYPQQVTIVEVGPRDGLQNEQVFVPTESKIELINLLSESGLRYIEATSFVSAKAIPQLADCEEVFKSIRKPANVHLSALVPNMKGLTKALHCGVGEIALFTSASEAFNHYNINCSIADSIRRFEPVMEIARQKDIPVRAYISCALGCPYEGNISPDQVISVMRALLEMGVSEICLGDTIGVGTPKQTQHLISEVLEFLPVNQLAMHFHDTYGQAIANIFTSLGLGVSRFDSSVAGLGGCPYARGSAGNVATEDVLYLMHGLGIETGIDIYKIVAAGDMICKILGKKNQSKVATALLANP